MHTFLSRLNALFAIFCTTTGVVVFACFLSTLHINPKVLTEINAQRSSVQIADDFTKYADSTNELGQVSLDLKVVLWDKIIRRGEKSELNYKALSGKYYFWDDGFGLRGNNNITLSLHWNKVPNAGRLTDHVADVRNQFSFPPSYVKK